MMAEAASRFRRQLLLPPRERRHAAVIAEEDVNSLTVFHRVGRPALNRPQTLDIAVSVLAELVLGLLVSADIAGPVPGR
jgi:hypothetical protein